MENSITRVTSKSGWKTYAQVGTKPWVRTDTGGTLNGKGAGGGQAPMRTQLGLSGDVGWCQGDPALQRNGACVYTGTCVHACVCWVCRMGRSVRLNWQGKGRG